MKAQSFVSKLTFLRDFNAGALLHRCYFEHWSEIEMLVGKIFKPKREQQTVGVDNVCPKDLEVTACDSTDLGSGTSNCCRIRGRKTGKHNFNILKAFQK